MWDIPAEIVHSRQTFIQHEARGEVGVEVYTGSQPQMLVAAYASGGDETAVGNTVNEKSSGCQMDHEEQ